ncbi:MAG: 50S ribosomal protein L17 [Patescibacteria group bacterium]
MRHRKTTIKLSRDRDTRRALMKNMAESLILYERIKTTEAKAKALRQFVEPLVTRSKESNLTSRRYLLSSLQTENAVNKLLEVIGPKYKDRAGGYTRIVKLGNRKGDNAKEVYIEFV